MSPQWPGFRNTTVARVSQRDSDLSDSFSSKPMTVTSSAYAIILRVF